jgi:hypothetical protein
MAQITTPRTTTGQAIPPGAGTVKKIIVNTHSSGVIKLIDSPNGLSGREILGDFTLPSGAQVIEIESDYSQGVHFQLVSGTATVQLIYQPSIN